ncbi:sensor histidine kinase [Candidatus Nitrotoga sp. BS]|uniref:sensor histidine kinase n=1 Tax=Candidatus Nitrotoga sp. BS TaxID=2890408 RepID=UPI002112A526|nr:ATP-binding protein [Candidatus Nitrotoga sp. BS]
MLCRSRSCGSPCSIDDLATFDKTWIVSTERIRVKQALINLLSNAIKYNREHGTVEVKCTCTLERIRISIKDRGIGLPPEEMAQLFQPFNRLGQEFGVAPFFAQVSWSSLPVGDRHPAFYLDSTQG